MSTGSQSRIFSISPGIALLLGLLAGPAEAAAAGDDTAAVFVPGRVGWTALEFSASKFLMSAKARVEVRTRPATEIAADWLTPGSGCALAPGDQVLEMAYGASGAGRDSTTTLWLDPTSGAALQRTQRSDGSRPRHRVYRYTDSGAWHRTHWPASAAEEKLPPDQWTERSEGLRPYPAEAAGRVITEPTALVWLVAAADLSRPGETLEILSFSRRHVHRVLVTVTGTRTVTVDYLESAGGTEQRKKGSVQAVRVLIRGTPLKDEGGEDDEFELLGLRGDIELLLEPRSRVTLALGGKAPVVGQIAMKLQRLTLR